MIRVPFLNAGNPRLHEPESRPGALAPDFVRDGDETARRLEERLAALELRLGAHAEELQGQILGRVLRIQSRLESALAPFQSQSSPRSAETAKAANVIDFASSAQHAPKGDSHDLLRLRNAREAVKELNQTLRATQQHFDALGESVERMRRLVPKG